MRIVRGVVASGYGIAEQNLERVLPLIIERTGLPSVVPGTLNVRINEPYIVRPDAMIAAAEYNGSEEIKLQRCRIGAIRAIIMRPITPQNHSRLRARPRSPGTS